VRPAERLSSSYWARSPNLQLGRAYTISRRHHESKTAYQDVLKLWKDADPDIPILKEAKAE
jgi:hypothetical protein